MIDCSGKCQSTEIQMQICSIYNQFEWNSNWPTIHGKIPTRHMWFIFRISSLGKTQFSYSIDAHFSLYLFLPLCPASFHVICQKNAEIIAWKKLHRHLRTEIDANEMNMRFFRLRNWNIKKRRGMNTWLHQPAPGDLYFCYRFWPHYVAVCRKKADEPHAPCAIGPMMTCTSVVVCVCKRWFSSLLFSPLKCMETNILLCETEKQRINNTAASEWKKIPIERDGKCDKDERGTCARVFRWWEQRNSRLQCYNEAYIYDAKRRARCSQLHFHFICSIHKHNVRIIIRQDSFVFGVVYFFFFSILRSSTAALVSSFCEALYWSSSLVRRLLLLLTMMTLILVVHKSFVCVCTRVHFIYAADNGSNANIRSLIPVLFHKYAHIDMFYFYFSWSVVQRFHFYWVFHSLLTHTNPFSLFSSHTHTINRVAISIFHIYFYSFFLRFFVRGIYLCRCSIVIMAMLRAAIIIIRFKT